jgi:hypothetical protein
MGKMGETAKLKPGQKELSRYSAENLRALKGTNSAAVNIHDTVKP